jgi:hypothetical protein
VLPGPGLAPEVGLLGVGDAELAPRLVAVVRPGDLAAGDHAVALALQPFLDLEALRADHGHQAIAPDRGLAVDDREGLQRLERREAEFGAGHDRDHDLLGAVQTGRDHLGRRQGGGDAEGFLQRAGDDGGDLGAGVQLGGRVATAVPVMGLQLQFKKGSPAERFVARPFRAADVRASRGHRRARPAAGLHAAGEGADRGLDVQLGVGQVVGVSSTTSTACGGFFIAKTKANEVNGTPIACSRHIEASTACMSYRKSSSVRLSAFQCTLCVVLKSQKSVCRAGSRRAAP